MKTNFNFNMENFKCEYVSLERESKNRCILYDARRRMLPYSGNKQIFTASNEPKYAMELLYDKVEHSVIRVNFCTVTADFVDEVLYFQMFKSMQRDEYKALFNRILAEVRKEAERDENQELYDILEDIEMIPNIEDHYSMLRDYVEKHFS